MQMDLSSLSDEGLEAERTHMSGVLAGFPTTMSMDEEMLADMPMLTGIRGSYETCEGLSLDIFLAPLRDRPRHACICCHFGL